MNGLHWWLYSDFPKECRRNCQIGSRSNRIIFNGHLAQLLFVRVKLPERVLEHTSITTAEVSKAGSVHVTLHWGTFMKPLCKSSITYSESLFADFGIHHAMRMHHTDMWPARLYNIFPHFLINGTIFGKKMLLSIKCVLIFCTTFLIWNISHFKKNYET